MSLRNGVFLAGLALGGLWLLASSREAGGAAPPIG